MDSVDCESCFKLNDELESSKKQLGQLEKRYNRFRKESEERELIADSYDADQRREIESLQIQNSEFRKIIKLKSSQIEEMDQQNAAPPIVFPTIVSPPVAPNNMITFFNSVKAQLESVPSYPNAMAALTFYHDHIYGMVFAMADRHDKLVEENGELRRTLHANQELDEGDLAKKVRELNAENRKIREDNLGLREDIKRMKGEAEELNEGGPKVREIQGMVREQMEQIRQAEQARTTFTAAVGKLAEECLEILGEKPSDLDPVKASLDYEKELNSTLFKNVRKIKNSVNKRNIKQTKTSTPNLSRI